MMTGLARKGQDSRKLIRLEFQGGGFIPYYGTHKEAKEKLRLKLIEKGNNPKTRLKVVKFQRTGKKIAECYRMGDHRAVLLSGWYDNPLPRISMI
ncbi:hypothetical protein [Vibrio phage J14]|nr:hypothetical protein [Vibrio phage J14]